MIVQVWNTTPASRATCSVCLRLSTQNHAPIGTKMISCVLSGCTRVADAINNWFAELRFWKYWLNIEQVQNKCKKNSYGVTTIINY